MHVRLAPIEFFFTSDLCNPLPSARCTWLRQERVSHALRKLCDALVSVMYPIPIAMTRVIESVSVCPNGFAPKIPVSYTHLTLPTTPYV